MPMLWSERDSPRAKRMACWVPLARRATPGCGAPGLPPVEGTVKFGDGKPAVELAGGLVTFASADRTRIAQGVIRADATYRLSTARRGEGAAAGEYRVAVRPLPAGGG